MSHTDKSKLARWAMARWAMVAVLLVAALLRLASLNDLPLGLHYDEAANLILTRQIVEDGYRPLFIRAYTGKEPLFFYAAAPWVWMTGGDPWGIRLGAAMIGVLTVSATYAAVRALFPGRPGRSMIALFAAGWLAIAFPHLLLSRYGFRAISQPLLQALTVALLWRGLRLGRTPWLVASGLALGLTAYTYLAARLFPVPLALALAYVIIRTSPPVRARRLAHLAIVMIAAVLAFAPLGLFFARNPETFMTRITQVAAPSWQDALRGIWRCLQALVWPGRGDGYIRFNAPGAPVMRPIAAALALWGLIRILLARGVTAMETAGRLLVVLGTFLMILPSALATGEITPSNLRMVGIYPFVAVLPAWGLDAVLGLLSRSLRPRSPAEEGHGGTPAPTADGGLAYRAGTVVLLAALLVIGAALTASQYRGWAGSAALFGAADGEMVLAAEALDQAAAPGTTVYIASEHYRHPTVAALATHYADAKWLTGGATLVLPPGGDAVTIVPDSQAPPTSWPDEVVHAWQRSRVYGPSGEVGATLQRLSVGDVQALRADLREGGPAADFAHVVWVYDAASAAPCRAGEPCPVLVIWEPRAPYGALQPVVRLMHPETGEWARTMAFHYPPEEWTVGDLVLDQLVLGVPVEIPPGDDYRWAVGAYDPDQDVALPRLVDEQFAGFEVSFPQGEPAVAIAPALEPPSAAEAAAACPGVARSGERVTDALSLLGASVTAEPTLLPGSPLTVRLCWEALVAAPRFDEIQLMLQRSDGADVLYSGAPAVDYGFGRWGAGEVIETRHRVRVPKTASSGSYALRLQVDDLAPIVLDTVTIAPVTRHFAAPELANAVSAGFAAAEGEVLRLLGYDLRLVDSDSALEVTFVWQAMAEIDEDYVVFVHLRDLATDALLAQVDEMPQSQETTAAGRYPTSLWMRDEVVTDTHTIPLSAEALSAPSALYVGLYLPDSGRHLTVEGDVRLQLPAFSEILSK